MDILDPVLWTRFHVTFLKVRSKYSKQNKKYYLRRKICRMDRSSRYDSHVIDKIAFQANQRIKSSPTKPQCTVIVAN